MKLKSLSAAALLVAACGAQAVTVNFGNQIDNPSGAPDSLSFATLTYTEVGADVQFTLNAFGLDLFSGATPFIGSMAVNGTKTGSSVFGSGGVTTVDLKNGGGPSGSFNFRFDFGGGGASDRLTDNESVSWTWVGGAGNYKGFALHVQGISYDCGITSGSCSTDSAWYGPGGGVVPNIPEPSTYALLLAGLGLVGLVARRRRQ